MALGTINISTSLVGTTLGTSSRDVGTLCTHTAINMWSRYKPVRGLSWPGSTLGFNITKTNKSIPLKSDFQTQWVYEPPIGGADSPYRLGDFRGYDHDKTFLAAKAADMGISFFGTQTAGNDIKISCDFGSTSTLASIKNMPLFANAYLGIGIFKGDAIGYLDPVWYQCGTLPIGSNSGELITIPTSSVLLANRDIIEVVPFISEYSFMSGTNAGNQYKYSLSATKANDNVLFAFIGDLPIIPWYPAYYTTTLNGRYGITVRATAISQRLSDITENNLKIMYMLYDGNNATGNIVYDGSTVGRMVAVESFIIPALDTIAIPQTTVAWGSVPGIETVKSVKYWYKVYGSSYNHNPEIINIP